MHAYFAARRTSSQSRFAVSNDNSDSSEEGAGDELVQERRSVPERSVHEVPTAEARRMNEEELKRLTKEQLAQLARHEALPHRTKMNKAQLARTLQRHYRRTPR